MNETRVCLLQLVIIVFLLSFLFVSSVVEVFDKMCMKAKEGCLLHGFPPSRGIRAVPYLQYVDDILVFYDVNHDQVINFTLVLGLFGMILGLNVNL